MASSKTPNSWLSALKLSAIEVRNSVFNVYIFKRLEKFLISQVDSLLNSIPTVPTIPAIPSKISIKINENHPLYDDIVLYIEHHTIGNCKRLKWKDCKESLVTVSSLQDNEVIFDYFKGISLQWRLVHECERNSLELSFRQRHKKILENYCSHILNFSRDHNKEVNIYLYGDGDTWKQQEGFFGATMTFDNLLMAQDDKDVIIQSLDRFKEGQELYKRVGLVWKRCYLLLGIPGSWKSNLILAIANHLNYRIYDFRLTDWRRSKSELYLSFISTKKRSVLVLGDFNSNGSIANDSNEVTFSALMDFFDGLWSSFLHERIILLTTTKDSLDAGLLTPDRIELQIRRSSFTSTDFKDMASRYFQGSDNHTHIPLIGQLFESTRVSPEEVGKILLKNRVVDSSFTEVLVFLQNMVRNEIEP